MASLIDSLSDVVISSINFLAIRKAMEPADSNHRYGHGKIEGLAALIQATFLAAAAFFLLLEATQRLLHPAPITDHSIAAIVMGASILLTIGLVYIQNKILQKEEYLSVEADKAHYTGDIASHIGILLIIGVDYFNGPSWVDPIGAIAITIYLSFTSWNIACKGVDMLLDREAPGDVREKIIQIVLSHPHIHGIHDLRTQRYGIKLNISFDVEINGDLSLKEAHDITKEVEDSLLEEFPHTEIMIHKDPLGEIEDSRHQVIGVHH